MDKESIKNDAARLALPVLVERLGGSVTISEDELEELGRRYGGTKNIALEIRYHGQALHLTLISAPQQPPVS